MSPAVLAARPLPPDVTPVYLAEGAANIIYRLTCPTTPSETRLLRLRKTLPSAQPNAAAYAYLSHTAFPLFPPHLLVATSLVRLPPGLLEAANKDLRALEKAGKRPKKRCGMYLETTEQFGFLITDMSPLPTPPRSPAAAVTTTTAPPATVGTGAATGDTRQILLEFKPKWLLQSPSAPQGWTRCRTCALRARKHPGAAGFCPLDLASGDAARIGRAVAQLLPTHAPARFTIPAESSWERERTRLGAKATAFLLRSDLMPHLKRLQARLDPDGPLRSGMGQSFLDAMTVRDLTVFLRVDMDAPDDDGVVDDGEGAGGNRVGTVEERERGRVDGKEAGGVECGVGDLDMKTGQGGKRGYWRETERGLVEGGWYCGGERTCWP
ncbi:inositol-pentakisphosphate 2-kinase [Geopyxis carbonaria]|nr:inositol-pentakisphosphate 2-kinase [Geopyxis carbonaria]